MKLHSFDVFDTLLTRQVAAPADLFQALGQELQSAGLFAGTPVEFTTRRIEAEATARRAVSSGEVRLEEIYQQLSSGCGWSPLQGKRAMEIEIEIESHHLQAVPGMQAIVQQARTAGFRVMFLSDMYLPGVKIGEWLRREGFLMEGDELFVSGELRQAKHNGLMFQMLRNQHPDITEWRHTGDHPQADGEMPRRFGITTQLETRCTLTQRERQVRGPERFAPLWRSRFAAAQKLARLERSDLSPSQQAIWESGVNVVGPLWFGFAEWCLEEAQRRGLKRLYFVARDGQIFQKLAASIARHRNIPVECRYLYGSRQAWHLPGLEQMDDHAFKWVFNRQRYLTAEQVFRRVGLLPENFTAELEKIGIPSSSHAADLTPEQEERLRDLVKTPGLQNAIRQQARSARELTIGYLQQEGVLDGTPYALVDIGWFGNMQRSFGSFLRSEQTRQTQMVTGFYFGLQKRPADTAVDCFVGYWPESGPEREMFGTVNVTILEMMAAADHGTVLGFRPDGNRIVPVLDGERNEAALAWGLELLQAGAVAFAHAWLDMPPLAMAERAAFQTLTRSLLASFITAPTVSEAAAWAEFPHSGEQIERHKESIAPALSWSQALDFVRKPERRPAGWWVEGSQARQPNGVLALFLLARKIKSCCR